MHLDHPGRIGEHRHTLPNRHPFRVQCGRLAASASLLVTLAARAAPPDATVQTDGEGATAPAEPVTPAVPALPATPTVPATPAAPAAPASPTQTLARRPLSVLLDEEFRSNT